MASGLDIKPSDFMNGNYIFNEVAGTDGFVLNSGIINAATGGNVTLLGKHVKNNGMIVAKLGAVNMAAGKVAVVTFDNAGLLGVKITKAVLQNELGIDPAVLNNGTINAMQNMTIDWQSYKVQQTECIHYVQSNSSYV